MKLKINIPNSNLDGAPVIKVEPVSPKPYSPKFFMHFPDGMQLQYVDNTQLDRMLAIDLLLNSPMKPVQSLEAEDIIEVREKAARRKTL